MKVICKLSAAGLLFVVMTAAGCGSDGGPVDDNGLSDIGDVLSDIPGDGSVGQDGIGDNNVGPDGQVTDETPGDSTADSDIPVEDGSADTRDSYYPDDVSCRQLNEAVRFRNPIPKAPTPAAIMKAAGPTRADAATEPVVCDNPAITPPESGNCSFTGGTNYLLLRGDVWGPENIFRNGMVLIDPTGFIACAGCDCTGTNGYEGATTVACAESLITPGLINGHDHVTYDGNAPKPHGTTRYEHRHEWRKGLNGKPKITVPQTAGAEELSELRHVVGGATSMFGSGDGQGLLRNLDVDLIGIDASYKSKYDTFPLDDGDGTMKESGCTGYGALTTWNSVSGFRTYIPHVAEGISLAANNEVSCVTSETGGGQDLARDNTAFIHGIGLKATDIAALAVDGTGLVWSPRSNVDLYGNTAAVTLYDKLGVEIGLGPDWTASGSMNMMRELNCADNLNKKYFNGYFSDRRVLNLATGMNAKIFRIDDKVGALKQGLVADIAVFSTSVNHDERAVIDGNPGDVLLVMRSGIPLYGDANLVDGLLPSDTGCEQIDVCGTGKKVCAKRETTKTISQLLATGSYGLFFCGTPDSEPSCDPLRPDEYTGITATDDDGDGVLDDTDNCPVLFNPIRPMDAGKQADADEDGVGDVCDPCPLDADTEICTTFDPNDLDGDEIPNELDNCPRFKNIDQKDQDEDDKGDVCDECPLAANPGDSACPGYVWDVKRGIIPPGKTIALSNMVVTAVATKSGKVTGFFVQADPEDPCYEGIDYSGIYVYSPGFTPEPAIGTRMSISGTITDFHGQIELTTVTSTELHGMAAIPTPETVEPADVATGGTKAAALEAVLVRVRDVAVTDVAPAAGTADTPPTNEFVVDGSLRVNDFMYLISPFPALTDPFASITGVLRFANENFKLEPRNAGDVIAVLPDLAVESITPASAFFLWGDENSRTSPAMSVVLNRTVMENETAEIVVSSSRPADLFPFNSSVAVPVGQNSAPLYFSSGTPGAEPVTVEVCATMGDTEKCGSVQLVTSAAKPQISDVEPSPVSVAKGDFVAVTVTLDIPVFETGRSITITADKVGVIEVPETAAITAGTNTATFQVTGLETGSGNLTVAFGADSSVIVPYEVTEATANPGLMIVEAFYDHSGADSGFEWVKIYNPGGSSVNLSTWTLAMGGNSWDADADPQAGNYALSGTIPAHGCLVIGGPTADAENGNPTFGLVLDFTPDLQNSGTTADGLALFNVVPSEIAATTAPVDVVIYGGANASNLIGPDGQPAPVNIGDADAGKTIARKSATEWEIRTAPTPNLCPPW